MKKIIVLILVVLVAALAVFLFARQDKKGRPEVVVVGGGIAGLTASLDLVKHGVQVVLLEKESRVGGRMESVNFDGVSCNLGTVWVNANFSSLADPYIKRHPQQELKVDTFVLDGKVIKLNSKDLLANLPFSEEAKKDLVASIKKMNQDAADLYPGIDINKQPNWDFVYDLNPNTALWKKLEKQSIREYLSQFHPEVAKIWGTRVSAGFGGNIDNISALFLVGWYRGNIFFPVYVVKGGNDLLVEEMSKDFQKAGGKLILNAEVTEVSQSGKTVEVLCRNGQKYSSNYVIVTTPANVAKNIIKGLSPKKLQALAAVKYVPLTGIALQLKNMPSEADFTGVMFFNCGNSAAFMNESGPVNGYPKVGSVIAAAITNPKNTNLSEQETLDKLYEDIKIINPKFDPKKDVLGYKIKQWPIGEVHVSPGFLSKYLETLKEPLGNIYFGGEYASCFPTWGGAVWAGSKAANDILKAMGYSHLK
ncbi:MAG: NAD(P)/FAD-dependent oxidoreductase [Candidatus Margulisiibacteriota bacterium]